MLTPEANDIVNHYGPGTLMGNLMRRYWLPALLTSELPGPDCDPVKVRILGEDLVAFRDTRGRVGLVDACCPHRGSGMFFGRNEENGLRCVYHGWKFDVTGRCVDMPSEPATSVFKDKLSIPSYPVHESGGMVWTYMGPADKQPGFRDFGTENLPRDRWRATKRVIPITFMQDMEGHLDTTHTSWLHMWGGALDLDANADGSDTPGAYCSQVALHKLWAYDPAPTVETEETWYGFRGVGLRNTPNGHTHARPYTFCFPGLAGPGFGTFNVPMDDKETMNFLFNTVSREMQGKLMIAGDPNTDIPNYPYAGEPGPVRNLENNWLIDRARQRDGSIYSGIGIGANDPRSIGVPVTNGFTDQDVMARQTSFTDRTKEHLGTLDRKIILMRRMLIKAALDLEQGIEPPALDSSLPYDRIGNIDQILMPGQTWQDLGTERDPNYHLLFPGVRQEMAPLQATE